ncbi:hypothetical protein OW492_00405 [Psychromonas sp. 14N.309.X.WAT.B.A12]|uniref:hypothetical protein n=1 Tax=Psychromonas sp. 14N.309.X.WAT.B.A12 TaxID=2998322 RepID=UPI0025AFF71D|nr:hypothetical protein [Psychromonas sp. 14N.309.X.WAT.B.A12]MDN2661832.1 hypothetical protein [Psychromonas sp. 14N.309.X.WAT.B.A12]
MNKINNINSKLKYSIYELVDEESYQYKKSLRLQNSIHYWELILDENKICDFSRIEILNILDNLNVQLRETLTKIDEQDFNLNLPYD